MSGPHPNPFPVFAYMGASAAPLAGAGGIANQVSATPEAGSGLDQPASLLAAGVVGVAAVSLAPLLSARRIRRMDVPSTLRVME